MVQHLWPQVIDFMLVTSTDWIESLDADVRDQFLTIVSEVTEARNSESSKVNAEAKQAIIDAGGVVRELTAEQRQEWVRKISTPHRRSTPSIKGVNGQPLNKWLAASFKAHSNLMSGGARR